VKVRGKAPARRRPWRIDAAGRLEAARQVPSPNQDARPAGEAIVLLVVHGISLPPGRFRGAAIERLFTNALDAAAHPYFAGIASLRVSSHFLVRRSGALLQFVPCERRAWHAGASSWQGRERCNDFSVGIELEGTDTLAYAGPQYATLGRLVRALCRRYPIEAITGHSDIAPGRKTDPGAGFDWSLVVARAPATVSVRDARWRRRDRLPHERMRDLR
jgi:AmpD protein